MKYDNKVFTIGDSHIRRNTNTIFNNSINNSKAYLNGFSGTDIKMFGSLYYSNNRRRLT